MTKLAARREPQEFEQPTPDSGYIATRMLTGCQELVGFDRSKFFVDIYSIISDDVVDTFEAGFEGLAGVQWSPVPLDVCVDGDIAARSLPSGNLEVVSFNGVYFELTELELESGDPVRVVPLVLEY